MAERIEVAECVLPGHPDKLCDAAVDAIAEFVRQRDPEGQVGLEAACMEDKMVLTGRIAAYQPVIDQLDVTEIVRETYRKAGYGADPTGRMWLPDPQSVQVTNLIRMGPFEPGERELRHLADDQAVCVGYAQCMNSQDMPMALRTARIIAEQIRYARQKEGAGLLGPDGKVLVRMRCIGPKRYEPLQISLSLHHHENADWLKLRQIAEDACTFAVNRRDIGEILVNSGGMFTCGGPMGDNGLSGKKLVADAYGPTVPIGGGAWSGKDLRKVDRLGGMLARRLAKLAIAHKWGGEALVQLAYVPGCDRPVSIDLWRDGVAYEGDVLQLLGNPAVDNQTVWQQFVQYEGALDDLARYGHFPHDAPWEQ